MASAPEERRVSSFPTPPALFYKLYTDENVRSGLAPKPPAPVKGPYHMFGAPFDVSNVLGSVSSYWICLYKSSKLQFMLKFSILNSYSCNIDKNSHKSFHQSSVSFC